jgi:hypothetical protein
LVSQISAIIIVSSHFSPSESAPRDYCDPANFKKLHVEGFAVVVSRMAAPILGGISECLLSEDG